MDITNAEPEKLIGSHVGDVVVSLAKRRALQNCSDRLMLQYFLARGELTQASLDTEELDCFFLYAGQLVKLLGQVGLTQYNHTATKEPAEAILLKQSRAIAAGMLEAQKLKQEREERRVECLKREEEYKHFRAEKARARREAYKQRAAREKLKEQESRKKRREASSKIKSS